MVFNSLHFALFFPFVACLYFLLPHRHRWMLLLAASCYFYMAFIPAYILILLATIAVDYLVGLRLGDPSRPARRKALLVVSLLVNLGMLAVFKYAGFLGGNLHQAADFLGWNYSLPALEIILPVGLSFHTFQSMGYILEVYFGRFALYVMYFPQLVAGPIERPQNLLHQFREPHDFDPALAIEGLKRMLWGLFKKVAIADQVSHAVASVNADPASHSGLALCAATFLFAVQIYCDFSGYSDIALGSSQILGIRLMENFRQPYFARSVGEFWRRWHISLSTWFRDYLYIPLGGNRVAPWRARLNLMIVFLASGLWHGADWKFVLWGGLHGFYLVAAQATAPWRERAAAASGLARFPALRAGWQRAATFLLVAFAWIFFRADSFDKALYIAGHLGHGLTRDLAACLAPGGAAAFLSGLGVSKFALLAIAVVAAGDIVQVRGPASMPWLASPPAVLRWGGYYLLGFWILLCFDPGGRQFIYFQF
jgi:D-alanyl-lipoteichoic acid acyltransferase DltB (MBOAT superfamily)